jgi:uncharacterized protein DUF6519
MKGDFTRDTYDPAKHFSRVLMQQGRVTLDADHNEQASILLHYLRTLARDLIGPYAAPSQASGFSLRYDAAKKDIVAGVGRYYVDGILVENDEDCFYSQQRDCPLPADDRLLAEINAPSGAVFWVYLDVWERHITSVEDDETREKALNGPDTCTRAKVVWQLKAIPWPAVKDPTGVDVVTCSTPLGGLASMSPALLAARVDPGRKETSACVTPPDSKYRGTENQLYRVEIHRPGPAGAATFKWARDNGSVVSAWLGTTGYDLQVSRSRGFEAGNWVELSDDSQELQGLPGTLVKLAKVEGSMLSVDPGSSQAALKWSDQFINPKVRRWDQTGNEGTGLVGGAILVREPTTGENLWLDLEDGVQVEFSSTGPAGPLGPYQTGDYWLIPARLATGNIEWPAKTDVTGQPEIDADGNVIPDPLPPDGVEHHYAPLAFLSLQAGGKLTLGSCQCTFAPASSCFRVPSLPAGTNLIRPLNANARGLSEDVVEGHRDVAIVRRRPKPGKP